MRGKRFLDRVAKLSPLNTTIMAVPLTDEQFEQVIEEHKKVKQKEFMDLVGKQGPLPVKNHLKRNGIKK